MASTAPDRIAQIAIPIRDLERAKDFYGKRLGLTHLFDAPPSLAFYQCGETRVMLSPPAGPETTTASILYYRVEDVAATYRALVEGGIVFEEEPHQVAEVEGRPILLAVCRDSEGNYVGLING
ncbi:MAG TPA: VOC family protein [Allosphingosinicella sp.]|jgi:methylmalonyl-CoA/ethylmalonyl-CoA epimerase|nr:VOC family protein [Allosphingosinicella sp.]